MKKLFVVLSMFLCMIFGLAHASFALSFTQTVDLNGVILAEGPVANIGHSDTYTYSHATPSDFQVPYDIVNSAMLTISAYWVNGNNDQVFVENTYVGSLNTGGSYGSIFSFCSWSWVSWDAPSESVFDIASAFATWETGNLLDITIDANGCMFDGIIELASSTFTLDYENVAAPVPEPATLILLGSGLLGFAASRKRKK